MHKCMNIELDLQMDFLAAFYLSPTKFLHFNDLNFVTQISTKKFKRLITTKI